MATRYEELQKAIRDYGKAAFQNLVRCKGLGEALVETLPGYLDCGRECVNVVPADGSFDARKNYGDEAFSFHQREIVILEPVRFGVALIVGNVEDSGAIWLRTVVSIEVSGDYFEVYVAAQPVIRTPLDFEGKLEAIHEAIYQEYLSFFQVQVMEFNDTRFLDGIGFVPGRT